MFAQTAHAGGDNFVNPIEHGIFTLRKLLGDLCNRLGLTDCVQRESDEPIVSCESRKPANGR